MSTFVYVCVRVCALLCVSLFPRVVIFTQPYGVTAQIINYSSPRERDSKRGSVTIPDMKVGARKFWFIVGYRHRKLRFCMMDSYSSFLRLIQNDTDLFLLSINSESNNGHKCHYYVSATCTRSCVLADTYTPTNTHFKFLYESMTDQNLNSQ